ncbi:MAG: hypothetical protein MJ138_04455 [Kiritimatiellae bacterium]|nr:hypothetical protein [Kiritimatiellia bacterium]
MNVKSMMAAIAACACASAFAGAESPATFRQRYKLDPVQERENVEQVAKDAAAAKRQDAKLAYYVVPAMGATKRLSGTYPVDGRPFGTVSWVAARDEYEPASVQFFPYQDEDKVEIVASDLVGKHGAIPASAVDFAVVKIWYQGGSAWYGYFHDNDHPQAVPELLLHDENLIRVDDEKKDYYVRYDTPGVNTGYWQWMSARFEVTDYRIDGQALCPHMIHDADAIRPFALNKHEFKQILATVHVPKGAAGGVYRGTIAVKSARGELARIPMRLRVLPLDLPEPKTDYNPDKRYYLCMYGSVSPFPKVNRNLAAHNAKTPMEFPRVSTNEAELAKQLANAKEWGLDAGPCFAGIEGCMTQTSIPMTEKDKATIDTARAKYAALMKAARKVFGEDFRAFSSGQDEGPLWTVKGERNIWRAAHEAGLDIMATTFYNRHFLCDLDFFVQPGMPVERRAENVRLFHQMNPKGLCGWYANPHCGPESPDYMRRIHGLMAWKAGYDVSSNYCWYRSNWNDFAVPFEPQMRGLVAVYATADDVIDTLAWEGVREGLDDIRYATLLKQTAFKALECRFKAPAAYHLGRAALGYVAHWDGYRGDPDTFRKECVNYVLKMNDLMKETK